MSYSKLSLIELSKQSTEHSDRGFYSKRQNLSTFLESPDFCVPYISKTNQNNRTKIFVFILRKINNLNKWENNVIVAQVKFKLELDALAIREQSIFIHT